MSKSEIMRYLKRARELREIATGAPDPSNQEALVKAANAYGELALWDPKQAILRIRERRD